MFFYNTKTNFPKVSNKNRKNENTENQSAFKLLFGGVFFHDPHMFLIPYSKIEILQTLHKETLINYAFIFLYSLLYRKRATNYRLAFDVLCLIWIFIRYFPVDADFWRRVLPAQVKC